MKEYARRSDRKAITNKLVHALPGAFTGRFWSIRPVTARPRPSTRSRPSYLFAAAALRAVCPGPLSDIDGLMDARRHGGCRRASIALPLQFVIWSIAPITDAAVAVMERLGYDAWGNRRFNGLR